MKPVLRVLVMMSLAGPTWAAEGPSAPEGKRLTDRSIELAVVVDAPPEQVFDMWTKPELLDTWFGADSVVDGTPGGRYEIYFLPREKWDGRTRVGSHGARLLALEPGRRIAFEWAMPPFADELNAGGLPTWVDCTLAPEGDARTLVTLRHLGWPRGAEWDRAYEYFVAAWGSKVLPSLDRALPRAGTGSATRAAEPATSP